MGNGVDSSGHARRLRPLDRFDDFKSAARASLEKFLALLAIVSPDNRPDLFGIASERTAYWINAYNATCIYGELLRRDAPPADELYTTDRFQIGARAMTLGQIENDRLNPNIDPRVLFAVNRCTRSSPPLRGEPYIPTKINAQLNDQAARCMADRRFVQIGGSTARLNEKLLIAHRQDFLDAYRKRNGVTGTFLQALVMQAGKHSALAAVSEWDALPYDASLDQPPAPTSSHSR